MLVYVALEVFTMIYHAAHMIVVGLIPQIVMNMQLTQLTLDTQVHHLIVFQTLAYWL